MATKEAEVKGAKGILALSIGDALKLLLKNLVSLFGRGLTGKVVTVDIDHSNIRLMEMRRGEVKKWASVALPARSDGEEEPAPDPKALGALIKETMASTGIKASKVFASVSGLYSVSRFLPVTSLPARPTMQESVMMAVKETVPLTEDRLYFSWHNIVGNNKDEPGRILVLGVPRSTVDSQLLALKGVGIDTRTLELRTMALVRAVNRDRAVILNIEPSSFDIIILVNGVPEVMRTIAWESGERSGDEKAEYLLINLELTRDFFNFRHPELLDPNTPLFITGQLSGDLPLVAKLKDLVNCPVENLTPPLKYPSHLPLSQYAVNVGLALKGLPLNVAEDQHAPLDINILPDTYRPWRPAAKQVYATILIIGAILLVFPIFQATTQAMDKTAQLQSKFNLVDSQLQIKKAEIQRREPIQKAVNEYKMILDMGGNIMGDLDVINSEAKSLGVKVVSVTHEGINISVDAEAQSYFAFREYIAALEKSGRFTSPVPPPEGYPYTTKGTIKLESKFGKPPPKAEPAKPAATKPTTTTQK